uniref:Uncharacterized protein n=1 Tax=Timema douglasi TaxID=61478 RepID=A0A7R8VW21_TIMDO|nr:unnamed protein product [Timema douglasi]
MLKLRAIGKLIKCHCCVLLDPPSYAYRQNTIRSEATDLARYKDHARLLNEDSVPAQSHSSLGAVHGPASYSSLSRGPGAFFSEFSGDLNNFFTAAGPSKQAFQSAGADFSQTQSADTHGLSGLRGHADKDAGSPVPVWGLPLKPRDLSSVTVQRPPRRPLGKPHTTSFFHTLPNIR